MTPTALQFLDSQTTDAQVERYRKRHKLLHDCKTKGFPRLRKLGQITDGEPIPEPQTNDNRRSIAAMGSVLVNDGLHVSKAAERCGVSVVSLKHYCKRFGFGLDPEMTRRDRVTSAMCAEAIRLVNDDGLRLSPVAKKLGTTCPHISNSLQRRGYKYNARTVKIERVK
jgi:transposase